VGNIYSGGTNNLAISIRADNAGIPTGSLLETVVARPTNVVSDYLVVTYPSLLEPMLVGGGLYWLLLEPADLNLANGNSNAAFNWYWSGTPGYTGYREFNFGAENWYDWQISQNSLLPAFRIDGTLVPEPSAFSLLLVGAGSVGLRCWRKLHLTKN